MTGKTLKTLWDYRDKKTAKGYSSRKKSRMGAVIEEAQTPKE